MRGKFIYILLFIFVLKFPTYSAEIKTILQHKTIGKDEYTILKIKISGADEVEPLRVPKINGLEIKYAGAVQTMEMVNFKTWSGIVLKYKVSPLKSGRYQVSGILFLIDGKKHYSKPVTLKVVKGRTRSNVRDPWGNPLEQIRKHLEQQTEEENDQTLIIKPVIEFKKKPYLVGEPIILKYYFLYNDKNGVQEFFRFHPSPATKGFIYNKINDIEEIDSVTEKGVNFIKKHVGTFVLIPTARGNFKLNGGSYYLAVNNHFSFAQQVKEKFSNQPVTIFDLPVTGRSNNFKGLVGNFNLSIDKNKIEGNVYTESIIKVTIKGKGNFYSLTAPRFDNLPAHIKVIKKEKSENIFVKEFQLEGVREYEYIIIPEKAGEYKLRSLNLNFFDPASKKYLNIKSEEITIAVKSSGDKNQNRLGFDNAEEKKGLGVTLIQVVIMGMFFIIVIAGVVFFIIYNERRKYNFSGQKDKQQVKKISGEEPQISEKDLDKIFLNELLTVFRKESVPGFLNYAEKTIAYLKNEKLKTRPDQVAELDMLIHKFNQFRYGGGELTRDMCLELKDLLVKLLK